jgi:hypothetical protein
VTVTTANVETLTAEVRVLMVGNRQVTLSIYRQLDVVELEEIEPFGRVNDGKELTSEVGVVGCHRATGALVKAKARKYYGEAVWLNSRVLDGRFVTLCAAGSPGYNYRGRAVEFDSNCVKKCNVAGHGDWKYPDMRCDGWQTNGLEPQIDAAIERYDRLRALHVSATELPLIVLAGLR